MSAWMSARFGDIDAAHLYAERAIQSVSDLRAPLPIAVESRVALAHALLLLDDVRTARRFVNEAASISSQVPDFKPVAQKVADIRADVDVAMSSVAAVIPLTPAELRVLRYLPTHLSFQAIGRDLIVSPNTVKTQAISVYRKLGVSSRAEAVRKAKEQGLLPEGETSHYPSEYRHTAGGARHSHRIEIWPKAAGPKLRAGKDLGLLLLELRVGDHAAIAQVGQLGQVIGGEDEPAVSRT